MNVDLTEQEVRLIELERNLKYGQLVINKEAGKIVDVKRTETIKV